MVWSKSSFDHLSPIVGLIAAELVAAPEVDVGEWQALKGVPQQKTIEIEDVSFTLNLSDSVETLQHQIQPNLPWAEDHFRERVSGYPHNPPPSHTKWPYAQKSNDTHMEKGKFSHTYPERFWPRYANRDDWDRVEENCHQGIRYGYGDLSFLVKLLHKRVHSRQAYLPVWFPEDLTAANLGKRVPCSLGYHFLVRNHRLKCVYYLRSCDFLRHFRDDVYLAARLCQWVANCLPRVMPDRLVVHISSLHVFSNERAAVKRLAQDNDPTMKALFGKWY